MSDAFVQLCTQLQEALRSVEGALDKAKARAAAGGEALEEDLKKHIQEAAASLEGFQKKADEFAQSLKAEIPKKSKGFQDQFKEFGLETQMALRHAAIFLAEATSKGAVVTAAALAEGGKHAQKLADNLKHDTAVIVPEPPDAAAAP